MVTLTSRSWGHFDLEPTYHVNMVMIGGHQGRQMSILRVDLERSISDLEGKKVPPSRVSAYDPKEHSYAFLALSYQNCRR